MTFVKKRNMAVKIRKYAVWPTDSVPLKKASRCSVFAIYFKTEPVRPLPPMLGAIQFSISSRNSPNMVNKNARNWLLVIELIHKPKAI